MEKYEQKRRGKNKEKSQEIYPFGLSFLWAQTDFHLLEAVHI